MRDHSTAGRWKVAVYNPWPCSIILTFGDGVNAVELRFNHEDLSDLEYVLQKAKAIARRKLGKDADEV